MSGRPVMAEVVEREPDSSPKSALGHETLVTLPNVRGAPCSVAIPDGSVMCAGPDPKGSGARSEGTWGTAQASGVTPKPAAQQLVAGGSSIAADVDSLAAPASQHGSLTNAPVTEMLFGDERVSKPKTDFVARKDVPSDRLATPLLEDRSTRISQPEIAALLNEARDRLDDNAAARGTRQDTEPSAATVRDYLKKCRQLDAEMKAFEHSGVDPLFEVLKRKTARKQTFYANRAALKYRALRDVHAHLQDLNRSLETDAGAASLQTAASALCTALQELKRVQACDFEHCAHESGQHRLVSTSKKRCLSKLKEEWRDLFLEVNESSKTYRMAGVLLRFCGLRPVELSKGVELRWGRRGVLVAIRGGKVRATAGQPARAFALHADLLPDWFVQEVRSRDRTQVVAEPDGLRSHLARLSERVFGQHTQSSREAKRVVLSAYLFRHALVTDLREAGWSSEDIAAVIGESTAQTTRWYGMRTRSRPKNPNVVAIQRDTVLASRPVRAANRSGLVSVLQSASKRPRKAGRPRR